MNVLYHGEQIVKQGGVFMQREEKEKKTLYDVIDDGLTSVLTTMSGADSEPGIKIVDNIISFVSVAGGAGASTIVANFAKMAEKKNLTVLVIDMNILYPAQNVLFNVNYKDKQPDLVSFLLGEAEIGSCIVNKSASSKISILSAHDRQLIDYINCDSDRSAHNLEVVLGKIKYSFDLILIDCPNTMYHDPVSSALYMSDAYYTVWDESIGCVSNFDSFTCILNNLGLNTNRLKTIVNKRTSIYYPKSTFKSLGLNVIGVLPYEISVIEASLRGEIYAEKGSSFSKTAKEYMNSLNAIFNTVLKNGGYGRETVKITDSFLNAKPKIIEEKDKESEPEQSKEAEQEKEQENN